jgi:AcrR family transcriptional regulator
VSNRGELTRQRLLDAAERLFAERGVDAVSLREINAAAGQRNNAALYYHFRNRDGLFGAIADRHLPRIAARQQALFDQAERDGRLDDVRVMVEVIVRPSIEYIAAGPSERAWLRIASEFHARPEPVRERIATVSSAAAWNAGARLLDYLTDERGLDRDFAVQRIWRAMEACMHLVAGRARYEDAPDPRRVEPPLDMFIEDLLDTTCAALAAPISADTRAVLERYSQGSNKPSNSSIPPVTRP